MKRDESGQEELALKEVGELLEMEMEEYDPFQNKYSEMNHKMDQLLKNLFLTRISNKRNELNILYLFQKLNNKDIHSEHYEEIFRDLDTTFEDVNSNSYRFDELISKNNDLGKRINPIIREILK